MEPTIFHPPTQHETSDQTAFHQLDVAGVEDQAYNSHPWLLAGVILALAVIMAITFAYINSRKHYVHGHTQAQN